MVVTYNNFPHPYEMSSVLNSWVQGKSWILIRWTGETSQASYTFNMLKKSLKWVVSA